MNSTDRRWSLYVLSVALASVAAPALTTPASGQETGSAAQDKPASASSEAEHAAPISPLQPTQFLRVARNEYGEPQALQTATVRYVLTDDDGEVQAEVYLESVVHIADASYYREFNKRFEHYDAVLSEMVTPHKEAKVDIKQAGSHPLQILQQLSAGSLGLTYQVDEVDYTRDNFIHSDLSRSELAERLQQRGDDTSTIIADALMHLAEQIGQGAGGAGAGDAGAGDAPPRAARGSEPERAAEEPHFDLSVLTDPNGIMRIRRWLATAFGNSQSLEKALPEKLHQLLVTDRYERAMEVFQEQLDKGNRRIALFWGAAHMPDFEHRLVVDYGMRRAGQHWRSAWDLRDGAVEGAPLESLIENTFRDSFKDKLRQLIKPPVADESGDHSDGESGDESDTGDGSFAARQGRRDN